MSLSLEDLNPEQREAVLCTEGPLLVLAGAGSGKTRVLTYRIAHIVEDLGADPSEVLALTFTNKAAGEMRARLGTLLGSTRGMWVSTFHAMCVRILRRDADRIGYARSFSIYDESDMKSLLKDVYSDLQVNSRMVPVQRARSIISNAKNALQTAEAFAESAETGGPVARIVAPVYVELDRRMRLANAFDFDDLLMHTYFLFEEHPDVLESYQRRFRYLLVDEYQDTNHVQYLLVHQLAALRHNVMVVGDDDQSIYSWRGADVRNILEFERDYPDAKVVKLERNYRSTGNILAVANELVSHNEHRKSKRLYTDVGPGEKVCVYLASDEREEGRWVAEQIDRLREERGGTYDGFAVLYRTNAQSRVIEDMFLREGIPYRIVGGTRFFDRAEIRDVMAYLKVVVNPADEVSAKRVINTPRRGIGDKTIARLDSIARQEGCTFMEAVARAAGDESFTAHIRRGLDEFARVFSDARTYEGDLRDVVETIVEHSGLVESLRATHTEEADRRIENIREFFGVVQDYDDARREEAEEDEEPFEGTGLEDFMAWLALRSDLDALAEDGSSVVLMTVHSAKGLEFPVVFVTGLEEGVF
ncbi:MAG: ATP-dependent helicase, partial [Coriobacteriales bacterium]